MLLVCFYITRGYRPAGYPGYGHDAVWIRHQAKGSHARGPSGSLTGFERRILPGRRQRIVPILGVDLEVGAVDAHLDLPVGAAGRGLGAVADGVLVARLADGASIGFFDRVAI